MNLEIQEKQTKILPFTKRRLIYMKLRLIKQAEGSLNKLLEADIPATVAFQLKEFTKLVASKLASLEEVRIAKIKQYGTSEGNQIKVTNENELKFTQEMDAVMDEDIQLPDIKVPLADLANAKLSAKDMVNLEFIIKE